MLFHVLNETNLRADLIDSRAMIATDCGWKRFDIVVPRFDSMNSSHVKIEIVRSCEVDANANFTVKLESINSPMSLSHVTVSIALVVKHFKAYRAGISHER